MAHVKSINAHSAVYGKQQMSIFALQCGQARIKKFRTSLAACQAIQQHSTSELSTRQLQDLAVVAMVTCAKCTAKHCVTAWLCVAGMRTSGVCGQDNKSHLPGVHRKDGNLPQSAGKLCLLQEGTHTLLEGKQGR